MRQRSDSQRGSAAKQTEAAIRAWLLAGNGILKTAKLCGISNRLVKRIRAAMADKRTFTTIIAHRKSAWESALCCSANPASEARFVGGDCDGQCQTDFDQVDALLAPMGLTVWDAWFPGNVIG